MERGRSGRMDSRDPFDPGSPAAEFSPREREVVFRINQKIAAAASLDEVMEFLYEATGEICGHDRLSLLMLDDVAESAVMEWTRCAQGECLRLQPGYAVGLPDPVLDLPLSTGKGTVIGDLRRAPLELPPGHWIEELVKEGARSCMVCPLRVNDRSIGLLVTMAQRPYAFGYREVRLTELFSERLSQAVLKSHMMDQLRATNQAYLEMLGFVSHELKNPLSALVMEGKLLLQGYVGELSEAQERRIGKMVAKAQYLLGLIREYLDLARIESGELGARPRTGIDLVANVIEPALDMVTAQFEERGMHCERRLPAELQPVTADPELLVIVMVNLLGNAAKYGRDGGRVRLTVEQSESSFRVLVWNEGPGFPESEKPKLFRRFSRLRTPELTEQRGTGVGLYTVWQVLRLHGGSVWAESEPGQWAEFGFEIPQPLACAV